MRSVAFAVTGIVVAACILAFYIAHHVWIIIGTALLVLCGTWLSYILESRRLSKGTEARKLGEREY